MKGRSLNPSRTAQCQGIEGRSVLRLGESPRDREGEEGLGGYYSYSTGRPLYEQDLVSPPIRVSRRESGDDDDDDDDPTMRDLHE
jgi:hypothetical protein